MTDFSPLERSVLTALSARQDEPGEDGLASLLTSARLENREPSGHGFFSAFAVDRTLPRLTLGGGVIHGPDMLVAAGPRRLVMGFVLWVDEVGYPECLEAIHYAALGEGFPLTEDEFAGLTPADSPAQRSA